MLGVAVLKPRPDVRAQPALRLAPEDLKRVAELEARLQGAPGDTPVALELMDLFMDGRRPDWAATVATAAIEHAPQDHRLWARRALGLADHFEAGAAYQAAGKALALCEAGSTVPCGPAELARLTLLSSTLFTVKDIDMRQDPNTAKERILKALRPAYVPAPRKK